MMASAWRKMILKHQTRKKLKAPGVAREMSARKSEEIQRETDIGMA